MIPAPSPTETLGVRRVDEIDDDPLTSRCAGGCGRLLRLAPKRVTRRGVVAFSETVDGRGKKRFYCRDCTEDLYRQ